MDDCSEVIAAATRPAPAQRYALPIPRLSPSSLMSSAYLIVRDPGHYRVASLSRGSHVTNGQRMVAVVAAVASVSDRGAGWKPVSGVSACWRWRGCLSTRAGSPRHGERVQPGLTQRDMWVMHSLAGGRNRQNIRTNPPFIASERPSAARRSPRSRTAGVRPGWR